MDRYTYTTLPATRLKHCCHRLFGTLRRGSPAARPLRPGRSFRRERVLARTSLLILAGVVSSVAAQAQSIAGADAAPGGPPQEVSVSDRGTVRLHVVGESLATVLHLLSLEGQRNIVASPNVKGTVTANLYDVTFSEALKAILTPNNADFRVDGKFIYVYTREELMERDAALTGRPMPRVYHLNYLSAQDALTFLGPLMAEDETVTASAAPPTGLASDAESGGGQSYAAMDFLVVTARENTHRTVGTLLKELDVRPRQALIEATILRAALNDDNALGIDFTLLGGVDLELLSATSTGLSSLSLGQLPQDRFEKFNSIVATDFAGNVPGGGLTIGIIKDHVGIFVRALEQITDTTVLANPKILALNRQKGQVIVGRRDGFLTTTLTETTAIQTVEFLETGTQLIFRPFIGDDGYIRVELHPEDSVGFVNAQGLPSEQTTEVTTNVLLRDGQTILIGGLFREVTTNVHSQVPGLGNLPLIGPLLRSVTESTSREEVIILLTIHIVKDYDEYADASQKQWADIERLRAGTRYGLSSFGRERIAQRHFREAIAYVGNGEDSMALWHVNMALHNHPRFLDAIRLKERLTQVRLWDSDGTGGRAFLHQLIAREKGYDLNVFGRPKP